MQNRRKQLSLKNLIIDGINTKDIVFIIFQCYIDELKCGGDGALNKLSPTLSDPCPLKALIGVSHAVQFDNAGVPHFGRPKAGLAANSNAALLADSVLDHIHSLSLQLNVSY